MKSGWYWRRLRGAENWGDGDPAVLLSAETECWLFPTELDSTGVVDWIEWRVWLGRGGGANLPSTISFCCTGATENAAATVWSTILTSLSFTTSSLLSLSSNSAMVEGRLAPPPRSPSHTLHSIQSLLHCCWQQHSRITISSIFSHPWAFFNTSHSSWVLFSKNLIEER